MQSHLDLHGRSQRVLEPTISMLSVKLAMKEIIATECEEDRLKEARFARPVWAGYYESSWWTIVWSQELETCTSLELPEPTYFQATNLCTDHCSSGSIGITG